MRILQQDTYSGKRSRGIGKTKTNPLVTGGTTVRSLINKMSCTEGLLMQSCLDGNQKEGDTANPTGVKRREYDRRGTRGDDGGLPG